MDLFYASNEMPSFYVICFVTYSFYRFFLAANSTVTALSVIHWHWLALSCYHWFSNCRTLSVFPALPSCTMSLTINWGKKKWNVKDILMQVKRKWVKSKKKEKKKKTKPILISNKDAKLQIAWNGYMIERTVKLRASFEESEWGKQMIYVDKNAK